MPVPHLPIYPTTNNPALTKHSQLSHTRTKTAYSGMVIGQSIKQKQIPHCYSIKIRREEEISIQQLFRAGRIELSCPLLSQKFRVLIGFHYQPSFTAKFFKMDFLLLFIYIHSVTEIRNRIQVICENLQERIAILNLRSSKRLWVSKILLIGFITLVVYAAISR